MEVRESISYNKDLITNEETTLKKYKPLDTPARGVATIQLFDADTGEMTYEAKTENVINSIVNKMAYMDYFYNKIKGTISTSYYSVPFQIIALYNNSDQEDANTIAIRGTLVGYADKATTYSGSDILKGTINLVETQLDVLGDGKLHFVFDFPTHAANGTFQKIVWSKDTSAFTPWTSNMAQGTGKVLDSQMGMAYHGATIYQIKGTTLRIMDKGDLSTSTDYTLGTDTKQNGIYVTDTNIWTVADSKKVYKYDLNRNLLQTFTISQDIGCGGGTAELHHIYVDSNVIFLGTYMSGGGCSILKMSLDLTTVVASKYYPSGSTNPALGYRRGGLGKFDQDTLLVMCDGHSYSLVDANTLGFISKSSSTTASYGWSFAQNENGLNLGTCYTNNVVNSTFSFCDVNMVSSIGAETLLASPITKTPTNTMKIQYDFLIQKVLEIQK